MDINKGDSGNPEYRSRIVAMEIKTSNGPDLFAATPPLDATKTLLSMAVTQNIGCRGQNRKAGMKMQPRRNFTSGYKRPYGGGYRR